MDTICRLPREDLEELRRRIEEQMQTAGQKPAQTSEEADFWGTDLGREILSEADPTISLDEVLAITAKIKGSLAAHVMAERA